MVSPDWDAYEAAVDDAIATCDGDLRGALRALIIANEHLERDLQEALAMPAAPSIADNRTDGLMPVNWTEVRRLARMSTGKA
jgi:alkyl hydroperoxide reductase subunit AhpC